MAVFSPAGWDTPTWAQATRGGRVPTCRAAAYVADQRLRQRAGPRLPTACGSPVYAARGFAAPAGAKGLFVVSMYQIASASRRARSTRATFGPFLVSAARWSRRPDW